MSGWPFGALERGSYGTIVADPPWSFKVWSEDTGAGRSPSAHYTTMPMDQISALPVAEPANEDERRQAAAGPVTPSALDSLKVQP